MNSEATLFLFLLTSSRGLVEALWPEATSSPSRGRRWGIVVRWDAWSRVEEQFCFWTVHQVSPGKKNQSWESLLGDAESQTSRCESTQITLTLFSPFLVSLSAFCLVSTSIIFCLSLLSLSFISLFRFCLFMVYSRKLKPRQSEVMSSPHSQCSPTFTNIRWRLSHWHPKVCCRTETLWAGHELWIRHWEVWSFELSVQGDNTWVDCTL